MSDTHTSGWIAPNSAVTTALPRLGLITCSTASGADEHPLPPVLALHPHRGLVGADHRAGEHDFLDRRRGIQQWLAGPGQDVADRALTDRQREQFVHQQRQPFHADGMGVMQIHHHRGDGVAERRSLFQTGWSLGGHPFAATRRSGRRTGGSGSRRAGSVATRYAHRPAAGSATPSGNTASHFGQVVSSLSIVRSGFGCSVRPTPGRLLRGGRSVAGAGRSCFWPCEGGFDELPGVFGGRVSSLSRASSAAMRASCAAMWASWRDPRPPAPAGRSAPRSARPSRGGSVGRGRGAAAPDV